MSMNCFHAFHACSGPKDGTVTSSSYADVYFCSTCGTDVPRTLGNDYTEYKYLNPHATLYFPEGKKTKDGLCQQCLYFSNLEVDTIDDGSQTANQFKLILLGIFMSPAIWIALLVAMPISQNAFRIASILAVVCTQNVYNI